MPDERATIPDEAAGEDRVAGLTSQPAVYAEPEQPVYDKPFIDPDTQVHTVVPGSIPPAAVADSGADLGSAQPAPLTDVAAPEPESESEVPEPAPAVDPAPDPDPVDAPADPPAAPTPSTWPST